MYGGAHRLVVAHSMKDYFTFAMAEQFFTEALRWESEQGYFVCHETHRKRFLHSPWVARDFLPKFPTMKLCADLSHWARVTGGVLASCRSFGPPAAEAGARLDEKTRCRVTPPPLPPSVAAALCAGQRRGDELRRP